MRMQFHRLLLLVIIGLFLSGCQVRGTHIPAFWQRLPEQPLYALRSGWYYNENFNNTLFVINPSTWTVVRRTNLPRGLSPQIDQDPRGRIWIGLGVTGSLLPDAKGMLVFSPDGQRLAKLDTCKDPVTGVEFDDGNAYIICHVDGISAQIDVFDLETLKKVGSISLDAEDVGSETYTLERSGGTALIDRYLLIQGASDSVDDGVDIATSVLTLIDTATMDIVDQTEALPGVRFLDILPYKGKFYGLNYVRDEENINSAETSLFVIEPGAPMKIERRPLALTNAMHGLIDNNLLYVLHSGTRSWPLFDEETGEPLGYERQGEFYPHTGSTDWQALSTYDLNNDEIELLWYLEMKDPNVSMDNPYPRATNMAMIDSEIILIAKQEDRIWRWNRAKNVMEPVMELEDTGRLLLGSTK